MHYIKLDREARWLEGTKGSISVLTMFKNVPAALHSTYYLVSQKCSHQKKIAYLRTGI